MKPLTKVQVGASRCYIQTLKLHPEPQSSAHTRTFLPVDAPNQHVLSPFHPSQPETIARRISLILTQKGQSLIAVYKSATCCCVAASQWNIPSCTVIALGMLTPDKPTFHQEKAHKHQAINMRICCKITISSPPLTNLSVLQR